MEVAICLEKSRGRFIDEEELRGLGSIQITETAEKVETVRCTTAQAASEDQRLLPATFMLTRQPGFPLHYMRY